MVFSSSSIQALPKLLIVQRDSNSSSNDLDSLLAARKTTNGFNLVPFALAANYTLNIRFSCPDGIKKKTDFGPCSCILALDTMPFETDVSLLYLKESIHI